MASALLTAGIVLCGGHSRRMGSTKAWLPFAGEFMLQRVVRVLQAVVDPVVVVAAQGQTLPLLPSQVRVVNDEVDDRGPLQGLAAGLAALEGHIDAAYLSSCDVPHLQRPFVQRVIDRLGDAAACVPRVKQRLHPLTAVYHRNVQAAVHELLSRDQRRMLSLVEMAETRIIEESDLIDVDPELRSLRNINTPAEYEAALRLEGC